MASSRTRDRLVGAVLGAGVVLVLLAVVVAVVLFQLTSPADGDGSGPPAAAPPPAPTAGDVTPPDDLVEGETWLGDVALDAGALLTTEADLRDVEAVGSDVRIGPDGTTVGVLDVEATVPFALVAEQIGPGSTVAAADDGEASVRRTVSVLGRDLDVVASGTVEVVGGRLVVEPQTVDVGGTNLFAEALGAAARRLVTIEQEVEGLPEGLVLREVTVIEDGFRARLDGTDVRLAP